jgi:hypothetical protein
MWRAENARVRPCLGAAILRALRADARQQPAKPARSSRSGRWPRGISAHGGATRPTFDMDCLRGENRRNFGAVSQAYAIERRRLPRVSNN